MVTGGIGGLIFVVTGKASQQRFNAQSEKELGQWQKVL